MKPLRAIKALAIIIVIIIVSQKRPKLCVCVCVSKFESLVSILGEFIFIAHQTRDLSWVFINFAS